MMISSSILVWIRWMSKTVKSMGWVDPYKELFTTNKSGGGGSVYLVLTVQKYRFVSLWPSLRIHIWQVDNTPFTWHLLLRSAARIHCKSLRQVGSMDRYGQKRKPLTTFNLVHSHEFKSKPVLRNGIWEVQKVYTNVHTHTYDVCVKRSLDTFICKEVLKINLVKDSRTLRLRRGRQKKD
jgi:hypothetical protein